MEQESDCPKNESFDAAKDHEPEGLGYQSKQLEGSSESDYHSLNSETGSENRNEIEKKEENEVVPEIDVETDEEMNRLREEESSLTETEKNERRAIALELKNSANDRFKEDDYQTSCNLYTKALKICPLSFKSDVSILYSNRSAAKMKLHSSYKESAIEDCSKAIELNPSYLKPRLRRAVAYMSKEKLDEASADVKFVLSCEPLNREAVSLYRDLQEKIAERDKKLEEMMGQLKQLGNMVLRPFGLSTENFRVTRDPTSSSYSVNFVQNPQAEER